MNSNANFHRGFLCTQGTPTPAQECRPGFEELSADERCTHAETLHRAYSIWECKGRHDDTQLADWLAAEAEVRAEQ